MISILLIIINQYNIGIEQILMIDVNQILIWLSMSMRSRLKTLKFKLN